MAVSSIPPSPSRRWRRHHRPRVSLLRQQAIVVCSPPAGTLSHAHALNEHGHAAHKQQRPADCHADQKTRLRFEPLRDAFVKRYPIARPAPPPARCFRPGFADADALQAVRAREERRYCCCRACCNRCGHACVVTSVSGHATRRTYGVSVVGQMVVYDGHSNPSNAHLGDIRHRSLHFPSFGRATVYTNTYHMQVHHHMRTLIPNTYSCRSAHLTWTFRSPYSLGNSCYS